jgi:hypothetical protein
VLDQKWRLNESVGLVDLTSEDFAYHGIVMLQPGADEVLTVGADSAGGVWKGMWTEDYAGAVHQVQRTDAYGEVTKGEIVYRKADNDTMKVAMYGLDDSGYRKSEPWNETTYKRQPGKSGNGARIEASRASAAGRLGELLDEYDYNWIVGRWSASDDEGRTYQLDWTWALNKNAILVDLKMAGYQYHGMIVLSARQEEPIQFGADSRGRTMKGTWTDEYEGAVLRMEFLEPDGTSKKAEQVYIKVDNDTFKVKDYAVESDGWRASSPRGELTFKRRKAK